MIWQEALKISRIIQICCTANKHSTTRTVRDRHMLALLQTCSQSRRLAQQVFDYSYLDSLAFSFVYVQPKVDIVYYGSANVGERYDGPYGIWNRPMFTSLDPTDVGTVAIEANYWLELDGDGEQVYEMQFYTDLTCLIVVLEDKTDPAQMAEFVDLSDEESRDISGFLVDSELKTSTEFIYYVRQAFQKQFVEWERPASEIPEVVMKKLRGHILGQKLYRDTDDIASYSKHGT